MTVDVPVLAKVISVFALILFLSRLRIPLSLSLIGGSIGLSLWMDFGAADFLRSAIHTLGSFQTLNLMTIVGSILAMSRLMEQSGQMERIVQSFGHLSRDDRASGAAMAALIGLLPMPGGALFSAPMVEEALCRHSIKAEAKTMVNYWFRHVWEYWWPLYPGVVLAVSLLQVKTWQYVVVMAPMTAVSVAFGVLFILKPLGTVTSQKGDAVTWPAFRRFGWEVMPIVLAVGIILVVAALVHVFSSMVRDLHLPVGISILPGLVAGMGWVCVTNHISPPRLASAVWNRNMIAMLGLVVSILVFKGVLADSEAVAAVRNELMAYEIPTLWVILIMPFLSGLITGISIGFVGASFPLIIPLLPSFGDPGYLIHGCLAYTFGYMGMMLSPVHLCFLVSKDYFKANLSNSYRFLLPPILGVMTTAMALFWIFQAL